MNPRKDKHPPRPTLTDSEGEPSKVSSSVLAAVVQMASGTDIEKNLESLENLVRLAASRGARVVLAPEGATYLGPDDGRNAAAERLPEGGPILARLSALCQTTGVHLVAGFWEASTSREPLFDDNHEAGGVKTYNTCIHLSPRGELLAAYRKIHLFDVSLADGTVHEESKAIERGQDPKVTSTPMGTLGLSICYDVRFPELYRRLVDLGATSIAIPSAFTVTTGREHWHVLVRARAIESQAYVLAPAQTGHHYGARYSYGHSMIVDPWGCVIAEVGEGPGIGVAEIDLARVQRVRMSLPSLQNRVLG